MAFLQSDRESVAWPARAAGSLPRPPAERVAHLAGDLQVLLRYWRDVLRRWSTVRQAGTWRTATERARQRRALARLSDRELRDIGITRYDVEFLLRKSPRP